MRRKTPRLPICDEFVVAAGDSTDGTTELLRSVNDPKIKIIERIERIANSV